MKWGAVFRGLRWTRATAIVLGLVFVLAGIGKILAPDGAYVSPWLVSAESAWFRIALVLEMATPVVELILGASLLFGFGTVAASAIGAGVGLVFLWVALVLPEEVSCTCLGILGGFESRSAHLASSVGVIGGMLAVGFGDAVDRRRRRDGGVS